MFPNNLQGVKCENTMKIFLHKKFPFIQLLYISKIVGLAFLV